jgi:hypothetical protein
MDTQLTEHPDPRHERSSLNVRPIVLFGLGLLIMSAIVFVSMDLLFDYFAARQAKVDVLPSPLADPRQLPPEPRLQVDPAHDLQRLRATEDAALNSYQWVDQEKGIVGIPIDRAITVLAEKGLPTRAEEKAKQ